ncbi:hypothetical protein [Methylorubrum sp. POS3]|uniref:hypothetical protein n=1 Tax=Methylorubrum sp. POS3 TaxID=2998492 RepID=UPI003729B0E0
MVKKCTPEDVSSNAKTLEVISNLCLAAAALVDKEKLPSIHKAMQVLIAEIDAEIAMGTRTRARS